MREIKYRAWDKLENEMKLVKSINYADDGFAETIMVYLVGGKPHGYIHGESCVLMQYTGLKDKNGKDIYEGDILASTSELLTNLGKTRTGKYHTSYYKVIWKDDGWGYEVIENNGIGLVIGYENKGLTNQTLFSIVIGNIYENPELI